MKALQRVSLGWWQRIKTPPPDFTVMPLSLDPDLDVFEQRISAVEKMLEADVNVVGREHDAL